MRGSRIVALTVAAVVVALTMGMSGAAEPSGGCGAGALPSEVSGATGLNVSQTGDPTTGPATVKGCNNGSVVPAPGKGAATAQVNPGATNGYVDVDGDSNNAGAPCTDGYFRIALNAGGPVFYQAPNGGHTNTSQPQSPDAWAQSIANNCAGPVPPL